MTIRLWPLWLAAWVLLLGAFLCVMSDDHRAFALGMGFLSLSGILILSATIKLTLLATRKPRPSFGMYWGRLCHVVGLVTIATIVVLPNLLAARDRIAMRIVHSDIRTIADRLAQYRQRTNMLPPSSHSLSETAARLSRVLGTAIPSTDPWGYPYHLAIENDEFVIWSNGRDGLRSAHWTRGGIDPWSADEDVVFYAYGSCWAFFRWYGGWAEATTGCLRSEVPSSMLTEP
jgi:Type II secretion system (T2SS), protein G